jgi:hypothetical protein
MSYVYRILVLVMLFCSAVVGVTAQESPITPTPVAIATVEPLPASWRLNISGYEPQKWNNCGPATMTNALKFFGYSDTQDRAAKFLKPNGEDKNVSPWQMLEFINTQVPEMDVFGIKRYGGNLELLKRLLVHDFPVIIESGYDPVGENLGWMGHYLLVKGYDDTAQIFTTSDSYGGENKTYTYAHVQEFWQHFNYVYIVLYPAPKEAELMALLGSDANERTNVINAFEIARTEATADQSNKWAWFNMGTNLTMLELYPDAAIAFDQARTIGLPFRMLWYQFGPYEAYYHVGRYDDMITLAQQNLNDGGGQYVEETYYYGGLARLGKGETERALSNFESALQFNPNFTPALEAKNKLLGIS